MLALSITAVAAMAPAQCSFSSVQLSAYGSGCNPVFSTNPTLGGTLDVTNCTLGLTVVAFGGCCNTFLRAFVLAIGAQPANTPLPQLGVGCTLLASPDVLLFQANSAGPTFTLAIPPGLPPLSFRAQSGAIYFTTIGFSTDVALTEGETVALQ
ncbi:MAG TPA: hypothetical protein VK348_13625 [Planctomycetota bacterium]|nr:hypothetical protein [Planctomycetota bacterium]